MNGLGDRFIKGPLGFRDEQFKIRQVNVAVLDIQVLEQACSRQKF